MSPKPESPVPERTEAQDQPKSRLEENGHHPLVNEQVAKDVWMLIMVFRFINALCVQTFFQPDEYFQSLEPAWQMAFGSQSGAWITWEWQNQLRSSLHPALFAVLYYVADKPMEFLGFFPQFRAIILGVLPNVVQALIASYGDYYTWQMAQKLYGLGSNAAFVTLLMTMLSPWQWFCSTRTFSNCLETSMTITALYFWPWEMTLAPVLPKAPKLSIPKTPKGKTLAAPPAKDPSLPSILEDPKAITKLRVSLFLAVTSCILRPTNLLIWFCVGMPTLTQLLSEKSRVSLNDKVTFLGEAINYSFIALGLSAISDRLYFGFWTFPPYQWLTFNVWRDIAVFYGRNDWHYYLSQGLPLLLTTYVPFALMGIWKATSKKGIPFIFATTILTYLAALSLISHKEIRFIYPLLPLLHVLAAPPVASFFYTTKKITTHPPPFPSTPQTSEETKTHRKPLLATLLLLNISIAYYATQIHQSGVLSVMKYIRNEYEAIALDTRGVPLSSPDANKYALFNVPKVTSYDPSETFVAFLMPCHSTPWRSQLFYPGLKAWALTCDPPLDLPANSQEREEYRDEADRFYDDPVEFLEREVNTRARPWPRYVVGFEGIGKDLKEYYEEEMKGFRVRERWRTRNSQWHDDWRRKGDVVVWEFVDGSQIEE